MVVRSTSSWVSAPATAGMIPVVATSMSPTLRPMPIQIAADRDGVGDRGEGVDEDHDVGGVSCGGGAFGAHRDADVSGGEDGRVIHTIADHHHRTRP